ncbi:hypothetical protein K1T71_011296 [Dendrolimus kikuchii]|uniref:Uncharacterized protein n=1 Tax=Dendrolimus kikuchii TaxID=765133 RepID=A0ACC1CND0_9NEOP|nr:hypothetical protein K1T71_011296 [Dendrolimus kikuchii]
MPALLKDIPVSLINPERVKKDISLTQVSVARRFSLSLRRNIGFTAVKSPKQICCTSKNNDKENIPNNERINTEENNKILNDSNTSDSSYIKNENNIFSLVASNRDLTKCNNSVSQNVSVIESNEISKNSDSKVLYDVNKPPISLSFGLNDCKIVDVYSKKCSLKKVMVSHENNNTVVDCQILNNSPLSEYDDNENVLMDFDSPSKKKVAINLEIKKAKLSSDKVKEKSKVLILNTNATEKLNNVTVQPPNYKLLKRKILDNSKLKSRIKKKAYESDVNNGNRLSYSHLKQIILDSFLETDVLNSNADRILNDTSIRHGNYRDVVDMNKKSGVAELKFDRIPRSVRNNDSPRSARISPKKNNTEVQASLNTRNHSASSHSPRKNADSVHFSLPSRCQSNKTSACQRIVPHHKIVAGTHFAVDAFSYGEIPNVNHYFLTHFHSDHYSGLKKSFKKMLFCTKITSDLCVSRLGVNQKCIQIIKVNETVRVEEVEVTALEANHSPFLAHSVRDRNASDHKETYPRAYCNPRYDFPTQDQSLEMALHILRQKKLTLEKVGKKLSSVLIICGTYTIGKEKFFLNMARHLKCSVWACPEKDRVLQMVDGRSFSHAPPQSCQLHVVPIRDLTHEKLRSYLDSLQGAFSEVVAFKPSGWENGKNPSVEKESVTIHGIPYSEHSSFSEMIRFVKFLKPKQVIPTVDISGGVKAVQKYFPCPLVYKEDIQCQSKLTDYFSVQNRQQVPAVT